MPLLFSVVLDKHTVKVMIGVPFHSDFPNNNFFPLFTAVPSILLYTLKGQLVIFQYPGEFAALQLSNFHKLTDMIRVLAMMNSWCNS